jgi:hypothetical protein
MAQNNTETGKNQAAQKIAALAVTADPRFDTVSHKSTVYELKLV